MTQPPEHSPPESIYTRLDGTPLAPTKPTDPNLPGIPGAAPASWSQAEQPLGPDTLTPRPAGGQHFVLATWGSRFGAWILDSLLFGLLAWIAMLPFGVGFGLTVPEAAGYFARVTPLPESIANPTPFYILVSIQVLLPGIALAIALLRTNGQTPGKQALGIRVVRADGKPLDIQSAFRRELLAKTILAAALGALTFVVGWLLNFLWPVWDKEHRAGHDFIANTRVVQSPK